jgi:ArsR family transcriptional regulator
MKAQTRAARAKSRDPACEDAMAGHPEKAARCLQVLGHPTRLLILQALRQGPLTVGELEARVGGTQANVSQHLRIMRDREILEARKDGNHVYYSVADPRVFTILDSVQEVFCRV